MTKWFNTNYHYLVSDFGGQVPAFSLNWNRPAEYAAHYPSGIPYMVGPFTFLKLSKGLDAAQRLQALDALTDVYAEALATVGRVHIDEPAFVLELDDEEIAAIEKAYARLADANCGIHLFTYYDEVDWIERLVALPVRAIGLDFVHGEGNLAYVRAHGFPPDKTLIAGMVDGRNVWRVDPQAAAATLREIAPQCGTVMVSNAGPLCHVPVTVQDQGLPEQLLPRLAFADEKLHELKLISQAYEGMEIEAWYHVSTFGHNEAVQARVAALTDADFERQPAYAERAGAQAAALGLPELPTTTIGSYPQTPDVRAARAAYRKGALSQADYEAFVNQKIEELVGFQEETGLDVLVHGEFERTDMVEFFAQQLEGIATTTNGWILSYGTRCYRPAIIYGDIRRPHPMTVKEIVYAQSLTEKPVKGMLTGAVTIIAWDFVREDIPVQKVAWQLALALKDEIADLETAGVKIIQIDEAAFKERCPIKQREWHDYFDWAARSFKLTTSSVKPETQIHSHMCYSEFGDIIDHIQAMDFDVVSIEASRSKGDLIAQFADAGFDRQIGLGVWDIHSPAVPSVAQMRAIVEEALDVIPRERFWINPDCGLKTRKWPETTESLHNMVVMAREVRA
jgi:5-methyltetrahydropteroyltriglutamate--homocysteine methyltransferase